MRHDGFWVLMSSRNYHTLAVLGMLGMIMNWKSTMNGGVFMGKSYMDGSLEP